MAASRGGLLETLATTYPRAKFVLTVRDADAWWASTANWLRCLKPFNIPRYTAMLNASAFTKEAFVTAYERYNDRVRAYFAATDAARLLVVDLGGPGAADAFPWTELCAFVEAWGKCPRETSLRANAYLRNDFSAKHADEAPSTGELADCAESGGARHAATVDPTSRLARRRKRRDRGEVR